ncbi:MAG: hypothetical protein IGS39_23870 [Calothrix sp. C42_A2020_038]|nr:hypothetical protein [Calothrix sp. C42_A2020_038]
MNNQDERYIAMKSTARQENLNFLSFILEKSLLATYQGQSLKVKCAVKDQLMVLIQHPVHIILDVEHIFAIIAEVLQDSVYQNEQVQVFVRYDGDKLPYTQKNLHIALSNGLKSNLLGNNLDDDVSSHLIFLENQEILEPESSIPQEMFDSSVSLLTISADVVEEAFDPLAGEPYLQEKPKPSAYNSKPILIGFFALLVTGFFGVVSYSLMSPCLFTCKELQTAKELQNSFSQLAPKVNTEEDLAKLQQQIDSTIASLGKIPGWSPHHQDVAQVKTNLIEASQQTKLLTQALTAGATAMRSSQSLTYNINDLQARSSLWRQAIAPLETIRPNSKFYSFAQSQLSRYRSGLQSVNVQILAQSKWQKKVNDAQAAAKVAVQREATAKSLPDLQRALNTWQVVVNALIAVPQTSPAYTEAQKLLNNYQPKLIAIRERVSKQEQAATSFTQAIATAKLAEQYEQQNQWQPAALRWQQALNIIKQIPEESPLYNQAQPLVQAYSVAFQEAQTNFQAMAVTGATKSTSSTSADLEKTCKGRVQICNFIVDERFITVRITAEYEQTLQTNIAGTDNDAKSAQKHLETLQQALEVIGDNANTAVLVFDAQGQQIFTHIPRQ